MELRKFGRYLVGEELGRGSAGVVYEAELVAPGGLRRSVALKVLSAPSESLRREARLAGLLRHTHLVDAYEVGEVDGTWFCALERCEDTLASHAPLPPRAVVEVGRQICEALSYAHDELGLIHLDIKPKNLFRVGSTIKLGDLGIARASGFETWYRLAGSPRYMAPEQRYGKAVDARTDLYALGVTLNELATGCKQGVSEETWTDEVPEELVEEAPAVDWLRPILSRCLAEDPDERFGSARELAAALAELSVEGEGLEALFGAAMSPAWSPASTPSLVGREADLVRVRASLSEPGLTTLRGPGGIGKTHLIRAVMDGWEGARWFVDLSDDRTREDLVRAVALALAIPTGGSAPQDTVGRALASQGPALLVLDNFEQMVEESAVVARWMAQAPELRVAATSREPLRLPGERVEVIGPLGEYASVQMLSQVAATRGLDIRDHPETLALARDLEGWPLALELAAGRLGVLSPAEVRTHLRPSFLRSAGRGRQATLESTLAWSWDLLDPHERDALEQLTVFRGGFESEAAERVVVLPSGVHVLEVLDGLCERSMLTRRGTRLRMLETIRAWAAERISPQKQRRTRARHADWVGELGSTAAIARRRGHTGAAHIRSLHEEVENLLGALPHVASMRQGLPILAAAVEALSQVGGVAALVPLAERMQTLPGSTSERHRLLEWRARMANTLGDMPAAEAFATEALARSVTDEERGAALHALARAVQQADGRRALDLLEEAATLTLPHRLRVRVLDDLAFANQLLGNVERARMLLGELLPEVVEHGDKGGEADVLFALANLETEAGDEVRALAYRERSLTLHEQLGCRAQVATGLTNLGVLHHEAGRTLEALRAYDHGLRISLEIGALGAGMSAYFNLAALHHERGSFEDSARYLGASEGMAAESGADRWVATCAWYRSKAARAKGDLAGAASHCEHSLRLLERVADQSLQGIVLVEFGLVALAGGDLSAAEERTREGLALLETVWIGEYWVALANLAEVLAAKGQVDQARAHFATAIAALRDTDQPRRLAEALAARARALRDRSAAAEVRALADELSYLQTAPLRAGLPEEAGA